MIDVLAMEDWYVLDTTLFFAILKSELYEEGIVNRVRSSCLDKK